MTNFNKNNLDISSSPYLVQHKDNPVHWQEWNKETLKYAKEQKKLIFVSIGYATCHWCHVMAREAFSDQKTADYLNEFFVSIKVDREQRPDLDDYFMSFVNKTTGHGGWPLNLILDPDSNPFFGGTYFPPEEKRGLPSFQSVLQQVMKWHEEHKDSIEEYIFSPNQRASGTKTKAKSSDNVEHIYRAFDQNFGGIGNATKFPPHNTLLFLLFHLEENPNDAHAKEMIERTLDAMSERGLHDHLQGGFYRYCVDSEWSIPHFEKMLYDQAMHLWVYALAVKVLGRKEDARVVHKLTACLMETFSDGNGLFYSAHDADTDHEEGVTYLWSESELKMSLEKEELERFVSAYEITPNGNFEGVNHLIRKNPVLSNTDDVEEKLLAIRNKRVQPFTDKKIVTSWNALLAIGLILSHRYTDVDAYMETAERIFEELLKRHLKEGSLAHSSLGEQVQSDEFLEDYAALLLLATYLYESASSEKKNMYETQVRSLHKSLMVFRTDEGTWFTNKADSDLMQIAAPLFDHPTPSATSLAEFALFRARIIMADKTSLDHAYAEPLHRDFYNIVASFSEGNFHEIHTPKPIDWKLLPINVFSLDGSSYQDCTQRACHEYKSEEEMIESFSAQKRNY
jgi:uncharacterized protein YyaL (SSP411 family)